MNDFKKYIIPVFFAGLLASPFFFYNRWQDVDFWGHLYFGKQITETKTIPRTDSYSYTAFSSKWIDHEWLSEVIFYSAYKYFQDKGLILLKVIVGFFTGCFLFAALLVYSRNYKIIFPVYILTLSLIYLGASFRPQIFTYLYLSIFSFILNFYLKTKNQKPLYSLPGIMILWANSHGGFVVGVLLAILFLTAPLTKKNMFFAPVIIFATLINPYGFNLWKTIFTALTNPLTAKHITEWGNFNLSDFALFGYIFIFFAILSILGAAFFFKSKNYIFSLVMAASALLAVKSIRHIPIFIIITAPLFVIILSTYEKPFFNILLSIFSLIPLICVFYLILSDPAIKISSQDKFPEETVKFIRNKKLSGNIFNEFEWGEYIIWNLYPQCKVAIDGRYDTVYPLPFLKNYFEKFDIPENTDFLVLHPERKIDLKKWREIYGDNISVLYSNNLTKNKK